MLQFNNKLFQNLYTPIYYQFVFSRDLAIKKHLALSASLKRLTISQKELPWFGSIKCAS